MSYANLSVLSDFGDESVALLALRSRVYTEAPQVQWWDINHQVKPYDIASAALVLAHSAQYLQPGIVLALVDPAMSRPVAVVVGDGESVLLGPDNGVLASVVALVGGATKAYELKDNVAPGESRSQELYGVAALKLFAGVELSELGTEIEPVSMVPGIMPVSQTDDAGTQSVQVLLQDRFGNCQLNLANSELADLPAKLTVLVAGKSHGCVVAKSLAECAAKSLCLVPGSQDLATLCVKQGSAVELLGLDQQEAAVPVELVMAAPAGSNEVAVEFKS